ncbi:MAG: YidC/Oxa1 family membrane protein insertase [Candidatus Dojkabacteria bacterium]
MLSTIWNTIFYYPTLNIVLFSYHLLWDNLGLAIIAIAILFRLILLPFMKRQTEMTKKMSSLKPQLQEIQKKYKNNPQKLSQEQMKLYKNVGYNPLGCLVTFLPQLLILSVLIQVIRNVTNGSLDGLYPFLSDWINNGSAITINTNFLVWDLTKSYTDISGEFGRFSTIALFYLFLSVLVGFSQYLMSKFTQVMQDPLSAPVEDKKGKSSKKGEATSPEEMQKKITKSFMLILPFSTVFIAISAPSALSLYWVIQSFMLVLQYVLLDWDKTKKGVQNLIAMYKEKRFAKKQ